MAKAIAETRAEVAESDPHAGQAAGNAPSASGVFAATKRIQAVAWIMRGRGLDPSTCDQIDALARSIHSASWLRDPTDRRVRKLGAVLRYLERRINAMLDSCPQSAQATRAETASAPPVDFLLEPLPPPATISSATQPEPAPSSTAEAQPIDAMTEIEQDLFAACPIAETAKRRPEQAAATATATPAGTAAEPMPRSARSDPLAALKAMSEEERIALFT